MEYLKIQSAGEIEIEAFTLIGASSKRNDETKIGYFGSGLKYSIAALLRNGIDFRIFQGENEIKFDVVDKIFRDESYKAISVNGKETSMTTTMGGKDWDISFAPIREIYSNALDEDDAVVLQTVIEPKGDAGRTTFFIEKTTEISHFFENFNSYFCDKNPNVLHRNKFISIYPVPDQDGLRLFRKGILCYQNEKTKTVFHYNSPHFEINESRVLSNSYHALANISKGWKICTDKNLIKDLIEGLKGGNTGQYEHRLDFSWYEQFSKEWHDVCREMKFVPAEMVTFCKPKDLDGRIILPKSLLLPLFRQFSDLDVLGLSEKESDVDYIIDDEPNEILVDKVIEAMDTLRGTRYRYRMNDMEIIYANFSKNDTLGLADAGKIILSTKLDSEDVPYIAKIIIEENEHNRSEFGDETRAFQNHLFKLYFDELTAKKH